MKLSEPPCQPDRALLAGVVEGFGRRFGFPLAIAERDLLAWSLRSGSPSLIRLECCAH